MNILEYRNNWASDEYYVDGKRVESLTEVRIGDDPEPAKVIGRQVSVPYYDMGHTYSAQSLHFFIVVEKHGLQFEVDLNTVVPKTKVIAIKFET